MIQRTVLGLSVAMIWIVSAAAQQSAPSYQADPTVYKVIFEDQNFRVIASTWKKGTTDKPHSHSIPFVIYPLTDCTLRLHNPDGTTRENKSLAGTPFSGTTVSSHSAENISESDCQAILVERK
ncbi:MAG: hypothetical protein HXX15_22740 [Rhodopseudomonas sp.]|uniref:hypothetical protein n=1 Tax=Rhodopseudomonas sp. TaxID=1078 RepID=UPI00178FAEA6|nr:hypothetical protein [Rhodopseudomonas sp.]NVN88903.1 hypothetical protein [Rhodopseudomonas sp.]